MEKSKLCKGPKDPNLYSCRHEWEEVIEEGAKDNQTYAKCKHCGLICPVPKGGEYSPECIEHKINQFTSRLHPSLVKSQKKQQLELTNATDFSDPRNEGCGECEQ